MTVSFQITQSPDSENLYLYPITDSVSEHTPYGETNNYECVDEVWGSPNDDTDYVYNDTSSEVSDWYTLPNHTTETGTINHVSVVVRAKSQTTTPSDEMIFNICCNDGVTKGYFDKGQISTGYVKYYNVWKTKPSGGAWGWSDIDNMLIGMGCTSPDVTVTENLYYSPTSNGTTNQWVPYGDTLEWECVDDWPTHDSDTTRCEHDGSAAWRKELYNLTVSDLGTTINYIVLNSVFRRRAGDGNFNGYHRIRLHTTEYNSSLINTEMPLSYVLKSYQWDSSPSNSEPWNWNNLQNLEIGYYSQCTGSSDYACTQTYLMVNHENPNVNPEIRSTQCYAVVNYTPPSSTVSLTLPNRVEVLNTRSVKKHTFPSGDYEVTDFGRSGKTLVLSGIETSTASDRMSSIKTMCHYGEQVTIAGLPDSNMNTDYIIADFVWSEDSGHETRVYNWSLTLEEV